MRMKQALALAVLAMATIVVQSVEVVFYSDGGCNNAVASYAGDTCTRASGQFQDKEFEAIDFEGQVASVYVCKSKDCRASSPYDCSGGRVWYAEECVNYCQRKMVLGDTHVGSLRWDKVFQGTALTLNMYESCDCSGDVARRVPIEHRTCYAEHAELWGNKNYHSWYTGEPLTVWFAKYSNCRGPGLPQVLSLGECTKLPDTTLDGNKVGSVSVVRTT